MDISIVLSFRNEEAVISELVRRLRAALDPVAPDLYELIFVNDASTDQSLELLKEAAQGRHDIKIINMSRRFGIFPCVFAGLRFAKGDAVIYMDADLQDPPEIIPEMIQKWKEGAEVVYTTRMSREGDSLIRKLVTGMAYRVLKFTSDIDLPVDSGDFKLLSRHVLDELLKMEEQDVFLKGMVSWLGHRQVQVKYVRQKRYAGKSHVPIFSAGPARNFLAGLTSLSLFPIHMTFLLGCLLILGSMGFGATMTLIYLMGGAASENSVFIFAILLFSGIMLLAIGFNGIYLGRIYSHVRKRPNYVIMDTFGFDNE